MSTRFDDQNYEEALGPSNEDPSRAFLIVARAIEAMAVNPTERQTKMVEKVAKIIAIEQTLNEKKSSHPGIYYNAELLKYEAYVHTKGRGGKKIRVFTHDLEGVCIQELDKYKKQNGL